MKNLHHHSKQQFQVERIVLFSDAVFAIAITLLIIEIKVPVFPKGMPVTEQAFLEQLGLLFPKFMGFIFSFFLISLYWTIHHKMFGYVVNYNGKLVWLNLLFLFSIVLMPFSTAVYSEYSSAEYIQLIFPYFIYVFNICLTGFLISFYVACRSRSVTHFQTLKILKELFVDVFKKPAIILKVKK